MCEVRKLYIFLFASFSQFFQDEVKLAVTVNSTCSTSVLSYLLFGFQGKEMSKNEADLLKNAMCTRKGESQKDQTLFVISINKT
jgi:hypothetical protein